jgi:hypothetical protein
MLLRPTAALLAVAALALAAGCESGREAHPDSLSGKVTFKSQPVPYATIIVTGPDGRTAGGTTNEAGEYTIPSPPEGELKFHFPPAGKKSPVPAKYAKANNGLSFTYTGGKQTYDIDLTP